MDKARRFARGRLSELIGPDGVNIDKLIRTFGLAELAKENLKNAQPLEVEMSAAYCEGVNYYVQNVRIYSFEYWLVWLKGGDFEPWIPEDTFLMVKLVNFFLTFDFFYEMERSYLDFIFEGDTDLTDMVLNHRMDWMKQDVILTD